ncbi:MAG: hypothetical protein JO170_08500, partial [Verrucomicrobia bacterium]|nr:hypothetical protein [Verrucomicrobiota bacterium]
MYNTLVKAGSGMPDLPQPASVAPAPHDPLCYRSKTGTVVRLPNYCPGLPPIDLVTHGDYRIRARPISPDRSNPGAQSQARFQVDVCIHNQVVRSQRYLAGTASLTEAVAMTSAWVRRRQSMDRFSFIISPNLIVIWCLLIATIWFLFPVVSWVSFAPFFVCLTVSVACAPAKRDRKITARLAGLGWDRNDFCRGWLITGDTGAGKTFAINALLHSVFHNEPDWGGLCCDEKGIYHETLVQMTKKYGRLSDLRLLQTKPDGASDDWEPPATFNLLSDDSIPGS